MATQHDLDQVMCAHPHLTAEGLGIGLAGYTRWPQRATEAERAAEHKRSREELRQNVVVFNRVCDLLRCVAKTKTFNHGWTSYGLKHIAERRVGYLPNGAFIAAAVHCGFSYKAVSRESPNAWFNMSQASLLTHERYVKGLPKMRFAPPGSRLEDEEETAMLHDVSALKDLPYYEGGFLLRPRRQHRRSSALPQGLGI